MVAETMDLDKVMELVESWPSTKTRFLRPQYDKMVARFGYTVNFQIEGRAVHVTVNYECHGTFGPKQFVDFLGFTCTAWSKENVLVSESRDMEPGGNVPKLIAQAVNAADKACPHKRPIHIATPGQCLRAYRCLDCGAEYEVDSSD